MATAVMGSVSPRRTGVASAVANTSREVGGVLGVAALGAAVTAAFPSALGTNLVAVGTPPTKAAALAARVGTQAIIGGDPSGGSTLVLHAIQQSFVDAMHASPGLGITFEVAGAESLPLPDASMDAVLCSVSAHHWENPSVRLAEVARVLRPGGRMVIAEMAPAGRLRRVLRGRASHRDVPGPAAWCALLAGAGFADGRIARVGWPKLIALFLRAERPAPGGRPHPGSSSMPMAGRGRSR